MTVAELEHFSDRMVSLAESLAIEFTGEKLAEFSSVLDGLIAHEHRDVEAINRPDLLNRCVYAVNLATAVLSEVNDILDSTEAKA